MMYSLSRSERAKIEFREAYLFYKSEGEDLADRFIDSVEETITNIKENPFLYPVEFEGVHSSKIHRALVNPPFPYLIFYRVKENSIEILSIFHTSRDPNEWKE